MTEPELAQWWNKNITFWVTIVTSITIVALAIYTGLKKIRNEAKEWFRKWREKKK